MAAKKIAKTPKKECPRCCKAVIPNFKQLCPLCGGNFTPDIEHTEPAEQMTFKSPALNAMARKMNSDRRKKAKREAGKKLLDWNRELSNPLALLFHPLKKYGFQHPIRASFYISIGIMVFLLGLYMITFGFGISYGSPFPSRTDDRGVPVFWAVLIVLISGLTFIRLNRYFTGRIR